MSLAQESTSLMTDADINSAGYTEEALPPVDDLDDVDVDPERAPGGGEQGASTRTVAVARLTCAEALPWIVLGAAAQQPSIVAGLYSLVLGAWMIRPTLAAAAAAVISAVSLLLVIVVAGVCSSRGHIADEWSLAGIRGCDGVTDHQTLRILFDALALLCAAGFVVTDAENVATTDDWIARSPRVAGYVDMASNYAALVLIVLAAAERQCIITVVHLMVFTLQVVAFARGYLVRANQSLAIGLYFAFASAAFCNAVAALPLAKASSRVALDVVFGAGQSGTYAFFVVTLLAPIILLGLRARCLVHTGSPQSAQRQSQEMPERARTMGYPKLMCLRLSTIASLFCVACITQSVIGIGWALCWFADLLVPPRRIVGVLIAFVGVLHSAALFIFGFAVMSPEQARYWGFHYGDATPLVAVAIFTQTMIGAGLVRLSRTYALDLQEAAVAAAAGHSEEEGSEMHQETPATTGPGRMGTALRTGLVKLHNAGETGKAYLYRIGALAVTVAMPLGFVALFAAAIARPVPLHAPFLLLFGVALWAKESALPWGGAVVYTACLSFAMYCVQALTSVPADLHDWGFKPGDAWGLWMYFALTAIFAVCTALKTNASSYRLVRHPLPRKAIALLLFFTAESLLATVALAYEASLFGFAYFIFFVTTVTAVLATSALEPPGIVRRGWAFVTLCVSAVCILTYMLHLLPDSANRQMQPERLIGIEQLLSCSPRFCAVSVVAACMMCMMGQLRVWNDVAEAHTVAEGNDSPRSVPAWVKVLAPAAPLVTLVIALGGLLFAGTYFGDASSPIDWTYFGLAATLALLPPLRSRPALWRLWQLIIAVTAIFQYALQLNIIRSNVLSALGFQDRHMTRPAWGVLRAHTVAFAAVAMHSNALDHLSHLQTPGWALAMRHSVCSFYPAVWWIALMAFMQLSAFSGLAVGVVACTAGFLTRVRMTYLAWWAASVTLCCITSVQLLLNKFQLESLYFQRSTRDFAPLYSGLAFLGAVACRDAVDSWGVGHVSLHERIAKNRERVNALRHRGAFETLLRFVQLPNMAHDFTERTRFADYLVYAWVAVGDVVSHVITFLYAVSHVQGVGLTLAKLALLLGALVGLLYTDEVPWNGTARWKWLVRMYVAFVFFQHVGLSPLCPPLADQFALVHHAACWSRDEGDSIWLAVAASAVWAVYGTFDRKDYPFYLRRVIRAADKAADIGKSSRSRSWEATKQGLHAQQVKFDERRRVLEEMLASLDKGDDVVAVAPPMDQSVSVPATGPDEESIPPASPQVPAERPGEDEGVTVMDAAQDSERSLPIRVCDSATTWLRARGGVGKTQHSHTFASAARALFSTLFHKVRKHSGSLVVVAAALQFALNPCVLNMPVPILSVLALAVSPRPPVEYWSFVALFTMLNIVGKSFTKLAYCPGHANELLVSSGRTCVPGFYTIDVSLQLACIVLVTLHKSALVRTGRWSNAEIIDRSRTPEEASAEDETAAAEEGDARPKADDEPAAGALASAVLSNVCNDWLKLGRNDYPAIFAVELVCLILLFFSYYSLVGSAESILNTVQHQLLPGLLVLLVVLSFAVMVVDRVCHLRRSLVAKLALCTVLTVAYHVAMLAWFQHQYSFMEEFHSSRSFWLGGSLVLATILYAGKILALALGATQVRHGFDQYPCHHVVKGDRSTREFILYTAFRVTPFVYDLGVLLDWSVQPNGLTSTQYINLNDVSHEVYARDLELLQEEYVRETGQDNGDDRPVPGCFKVQYGWSIFLLLAVVLVFPLVAYSSLSPALQDNWIQQADIEVSLPGAPLLWSSSVGAPLGSTALNSSVTDLVKLTRPSLTGAGLGDGHAQGVSFTQFSTNTWAISGPALEALNRTLMIKDADVNLQIEIKLRSQTAFLGLKTRAMQIARELSFPERKQLAAVLEGTAQTLHLPRIMSPFIRNLGGEVTAAVTNAADWASCNLTLQTEGGSGYFGFECTTIFDRSNPSGGGQWNDLSDSEWHCLNYATGCPNYEKSPIEHYAPPFLLVSSSPVLAVGFLQSVGIIAAYTTFVLAIGRVVRFAFSGGAYRVTLENMEDTSILANLIEYVSMTRSRGNFRAERRAFHVLMNILRVTEVLEKKTRRTESAGDGAAAGS